MTARFDKPRLVASSLIEKLLNAPKSTNETLIDLNKFLLIFDEGVSVLESMKIPNLGDFILFSLASRCLPSYSIKLFEAQLVKSRINVLECVLSVSRESVHKSVKQSALQKPYVTTKLYDSGANNFKRP